MQYVLLLNAKVTTESIKHLESIVVEGSDKASRVYGR